MYIEKIRRQRPNPGDVFGRLTVVEKATKHGGNYLCRCSCGDLTIVQTHRLQTGHTQSCGCLERENAAKRLRTHGLTAHPLYGVWRAMHRRCSNKSDRNYPNYGGRGVYVDARWQELDVFLSWAKENGYNRGLALDRRNNDGPYSPENCRFVTCKINANNTRVNRYFTIFGERKTLTEWSEDPRCVVPPTVFKERLRRHRGRGRQWTALAALTEPFYPKRWNRRMADADVAV